MEPRDTSMQQPPKIIPVDMVSPSAPQYPQQATPEQPPQDGKLSEWWQWFTLRRHAPRTYDGRRQQQYEYQQPPQPYPPYQQPQEYQQYPQYQPQYQSQPQYQQPAQYQYPSYPQQPQNQPYTQYSRPY